MAAVRAYPSGLHVRADVVGAVNWLALYFVCLAIWLLNRWK